MSALRVLDLFSGIGGFSLGMERTGGFKTVAFCEIEPFPRRVLAKHWPEVPCYDDVRTLTAERLAADGIGVDVICGGFPCQDISHAGAGAGIEGARSGLWSEYHRLIGELRPAYVIVENVAALLGRGLDKVLGDLATLGFDAEWHCIPAASVGAPHLRDRVWIIAYPQHSDTHGAGSHRAEVDQFGSPEFQHEQVSQPGSFRRNVANAARERWYRRGRGAEFAGGRESSNSREAMADAEDRGQQGSGHVTRARGQAGQPFSTAWWATEPDVGRVAHGIPSRVDRLKGLGNAVVPQIPEMIGRAIVAAESEARRAAA